MKGKKNAKRRRIRVLLDAAYRGIEEMQARDAHVQMRSYWLLGLSVAGIGIAVTRDATLSALVFAAAAIVFIASVHPMPTPTLGARVETLYDNPDSGEEDLLNELVSDQSVTSEYEDVIKKRVGRYSKGLVVLAVGSAVFVLETIFLECLVSKAIEKFGGNHG